MFGFCNNLHYWWCGFDIMQWFCVTHKFGPPSVAKKSLDLQLQDLLCFCLFLFLVQFVTSQLDALLGEWPRPQPDVGSSTLGLPGFFLFYRWKIHFHMCGRSMKAWKRKTDCKQGLHMLLLIYQDNGSCRAARGWSDQGSTPTTSFAVAFRSTATCPVVLAGDTSFWMPHPSE